MQDISEKWFTGFALIAVLLATAGTYMDFKTHKIPNSLTIPAMALGIGMNVAMFGTEGGLKSALGIFVGTITILIWIIGGLKAGDCKLYMAIGSIMGAGFCLDTVVASILIGGAAAFIKLLISNRGKGALRDMWHWFIGIIYTRQIMPYVPHDQQGYFCFACCILLGVIAVTIKRYQNVL